MRGIVKEAGSNTSPPPPPPPTPRPSFSPNSSGTHDTWICCIHDHDSPARADRHSMAQRQTSKAVTAREPKVNQRLWIGRREGEGGLG